MTMNTSKLWFILIFLCVAIFHATGQISLSPLNPSVCVNGTVTFTISGSSFSSGFNWTIPPSATIVSGNGTKTVSVKFNSPGSGYQIQVSGNDIQSYLMTTVNVLTPAGTPGTIQGSSTICRGATTTLSIPPIGNAIQTVWFASGAGLTIVSQSSTTVTISAASNFNSGSITVYGVNGPCGGGATSQKTITALGTTPSTPTIINGLQVVNPGASNVQYSIAALENATSYNWTVPSGVTITSGANTATITVSFSPTYVSGTIGVRGVNSVCTGQIMSKSVVSSALPATPTNIIGSTTLCHSLQGTTTEYSVSIPNATSFTWNVVGGSIVSGLGSSTITVQFAGAITSASISVYGTNTYGNGGTLTRNISMYRPAASAGWISGPTEFCVGQAQTGVVYSVTPIEGASPHVWNVPSGMTITAGANTATITVNVASNFTGGTITVFGVGGPCGAAPSSSIKVNSTIFPQPPGTITGKELVCRGQKEVRYSVPNQLGGNYVWNVPNGATLKNGLGSNEVVVDFSTSFTGGTINVSMTNGCGNGSTSSLYVNANWSATFPPSITNQPSSSEWYPSMPDKQFHVVASGTGLLYQWRKNGKNIPGASSSIYTISNVQWSDEGNYDVLVMNSDGCVTLSTTARFNVHHQIGENYVISQTVLSDNQFKEDEIMGLSVDQLKTDIVYFDGLGREKQVVSWQGSPSKKDIVKPSVYDVLGRPDKQYLPYVSNEASGLMKDVTFTVEGDYTHDFYKSSGTIIASDVRPFTQTIYEPSPLSRITKQYNAGQAWFDQDKAVHFKEIINSDGETVGKEKIIAWTVVSGMPIRNTAVTSTSGQGYYPTGKLKISVSIDENGNETREYSTHVGRVILKKVYAQGVKTDFATIGNWAETYYLYDDLGNLRYVFQPELSKLLASSSSSNPSQLQLDQLSFIYKYDSRKRMIEKKVPGSDPIYMIYNKRNLLVMTQDGKQRKDSNGNITGKEWTYTKYDQLNRPIITGIYIHREVLSREQMVDLANVSPSLVEHYNGNSSTMGYSNTVFSNLGFMPAGFKVLTVMYYDNYNFKNTINDANSNYLNSELVTIDPFRGRDRQEAIENLVVTNQITGQRTNILGTSTYLWTVNYYDRKSRLIQTVSSNHVNGIDRLTNRYDYINLRDMRWMHNKGISSNAITRHFDYDHAGRLLKTFHRINNDNEVLLAKNDYNELGQLVAKELHSRNNAEATQTVDYRYNIRGWLTSINDPAINPNSLFNFQLKYNDPTIAGTNAQFNGNISQTTWRTAGNDEASYAYKYDPMNRLTEANYYNHDRPLQNGRYNETIKDGSSSGYDLNGNIKKLQRYGKLGDNSYGLMDNLSYDYTNSGNRLLKVSDGGNITTGFKDGNTNGNDYEYDANGNMTVDKNKGISGISGNVISYNYLNLPEKVQKSATQFVNYIYDATGRKLTQNLTDGATTKRTDYAGEFIYENDTLRFINHEEGRILPDITTEAEYPWEYQYHLKDHLGNVRVTFSEKTTATEYLATMERMPTSIETEENGEFLNSINSRKRPKNNRTPGVDKSYSYRLRGFTNEVVGLAKSLEVQAGDRIDMEVYAKYDSLTTTNSNAGTLVTALISAFSLSTSGGTVLTGENARNAFTGNSGYFGGGEGDDEDAPRAYLNYILFNENFGLVDLGYDRITTDAVSAHERLSLNIKIDQPGYLYIYISNEHNKIVNVYFDDFKIVHHTAVEQSDDYYAFGLTFNSYQRENNTKNSYLYNGKELQDELDLGWLDYGARMYMPEIGRWGVSDELVEKFYSLSPYNYAANSPLVISDPDGRDISFSFVYDKDDDGNIKRDKDGNATILSVTMNVTGKVVNVTDKEIDLDGAAEDISAAIEGSFNGNIGGVEFNTKTNITAAKSMDEVSDTDHVFALATMGEIGNTGVTPLGIVNDFGGKVAFIDVDYFSGPFDTTIGNQGERTASHEFGHLANLRHRNKDKLSLMRQGGRSVFGYNFSTLITSDQLNSILYSYTQNLLNKGENYEYVTDKNGNKRKMPKRGHASQVVDY